MAIIRYPNYADPDSDVVITGKWEINRVPATGLDLTNKNYVDNTISSSSVVSRWVNTTTYTPGSVVYYSNAFWNSRSTNTGSAPSPTNGNWRQMSNIFSARDYSEARTVSSNTQMNAGDTAIIAYTQAGNVVLTLPSISSLSSVDTAGTVQMYRIYKTGRLNNVTVTCSGSDKYSDGTTSFSVSADGSVITLYCMFDANMWFKG